MTTKPATRIYALIAPRARIAVVFRQGPSRQVLLLRWNMAVDSFESGQWFKGRIYERCCDLSPSGKYLVYFAGNQKPPYYSWTAVSKPPYLTALTLWPSGGSGGGGLFKSDSSLYLNHNLPTDGLALRSSVPKGFDLLPFAENIDRSQSHFILKQRMKRDGWIEVQKGIAHSGGPSFAEMMERTTAIKKLLAEEGPGFDSSKLPETFNTKTKTPAMWTVFEPVDIWQKSTSSYRLEMRTLGFGETNGPTVVTEYSVLALDGCVLIDLGRADWADWDSNGDLLYAKSGAIYRLPKAEIGKGEARMLIDLTQERFRPLEAPKQYRSW